MELTVAKLINFSFLKQLLIECSHDGCGLTNETDICNTTFGLFFFHQIKEHSKPKAHLQKLLANTQCSEAILTAF